jgi:hypothetical protein
MLRGRRGRCNSHGGLVLRCPAGLLTPLNAPVHGTRHRDGGGGFQKAHISLLMLGFLYDAESERASLMWTRPHRGPRLCRSQVNRR